jgi:hypothetical protein
MKTTDITENRGRDGYAHYGTPPQLIGSVGEYNMASDLTVFACEDSEIGPFIEIVGQELTDTDAGSISRDSVIVELAYAVELATHIIKAAALLGLWNWEGTQDK